MPWFADCGDELNTIAVASWAHAGEAANRGIRDQASVGGCRSVAREEVPVDRASWKRSPLAPNTQLAFDDTGSPVQTMCENPDLKANRESGRPPSPPPR